MISSLGHYNLIKEISSGGMATVYLAKDRRNNRNLAIKLLNERISSKEKINERFFQEGLLKLNHKNIVKVLDIGKSSHGPYIVMEYIEGTDLADYIKKRGKLDVKTSLDIFIQILNALLYVHSLGIIHRDIKPKNILIDKFGTVKLTDFGIAKSVYSHIKTSTGGFIGAPAYSSPEQMDGKAVDERSDIYSLGITLYEMLAGHIPYSSSSLDVIVKEKFSDSLIPLQRYRDDVPSFVLYIISRCVSKNPSDRFSKISEIIFNLNKDIYEETIIKKLPIISHKFRNKFTMIISITLPIILVITIFAIYKSYIKEEIIIETTTIESSKITSETIAIATIPETISEEKTVDTTAIETTVIKSDLNIGDIGPAGGYIFYINTDYKNAGWHYLEAAAFDQIVGINWFNGNYIETGAISTVIGLGKENTRKIVDIQGIGNYAAWICINQNINGYNDWFLPSRDELDLMYKNLYLNNIGDFNPGGYWSSSEVDIHYVWDQTFNNGDQGIHYKNDSASVRAIRFIK